MELRLHPEDIKELAQELHRLQEQQRKESDIVYLKDLTDECKCSFYTLNERRKQKFIPKVEGVREVAVYRKYVPELKKAS